MWIVRRPPRHRCRRRARAVDPREALLLCELLGIHIRRAGLLLGACWVCELRGGERELLLLHLHLHLHLVWERRGGLREGMLVSLLVCVALCVVCVWEGGGERAHVEAVM